ncbi:MAG: DEAD/DEAH box helicase [Victivallales bacterium]
MGLVLALSPHRHLYVLESEEAENTFDTAFSNTIFAEFAKSSADGLMCLVSLESKMPLHPSFAFWRRLSGEYLTRLSHIQDLETTDEVGISPPSPAELAEMILEAPPMTGSEYINQDVIIAIWNEFDLSARQKIKAFPGGVKEWLKSLNPEYRLLGKVTFHLAENKKNPAMPFAFIVTYSHRLSEKGEARHLPLSNALHEYSGGGNHKALLSLLMPVQRASEKSPFIKELLESKKIFRPLAWSPGDAYKFLKDVHLFESSGVITRIPDWWRSANPPRPKVKVSIDLKNKNTLGFDALLTCSCGMTLGDEELTQEEIEKLRTCAKGLVFLKGKWVEADPDKLKEVLEQWRKIKEDGDRDGISFIDAMRMLSGAGIGEDTAVSGKDESGTWADIAAAGDFEKILSGLREPGKIICPEPEGLKAELRHYQETGVKWLWFISKLGLGACLADDMGLGKTVQLLAILLLIKKENETAGNSGRKTSVLVVPSSLVANWKSESAKFAPALKIFYAHPSETSQEELDLAAKSPERHLAAYDAVITTYSMITRMEWLKKMKWSLAVLDEAQAIKNPGAKQTRAVKQLDAKCRFVLTGTPVENKLSDLWSIFDFICPSLLGTQKEFAEFAKKLSSDSGVNYAPLRSITKPYILRRLKTDKTVITDLPDKTELKAFCTLSAKQALLYQDSVKELAQKIEEADSIKRRGLIFAYLMRFKQICNHPSQWLSDGAYQPADSGKFARIREITEEIASRQEKVLVFTQFREITDTLKSYLEKIFGRTGLVLHGSTPIKERHLLVQDFQRENGPPFFILSLKAGGIGLNLTEASHVIHFDRWWNPAVENQATDRAFRIGQKKNVLVHKFICRGTLEEKIDALIDEKKGMSDQLLAGGCEKLLTDMSDSELVKFVSMDIKSAPDII